MAENKTKGENENEEETGNKMAKLPETRFCTDGISEDGQARIGAISRCIDDYFESLHRQHTPEDSLLIKCVPVITNTFRYVMYPDQLYRLSTSHLLASWYCLNWYLNHEYWGNDINDKDEAAMVRKISQELLFLVTQRAIDSIATSIQITRD